MEDKNLMEVAKRLYDFTDPWDREDMTVKDFAKVIRTNPYGTINHLLDIIDELQA